MLRSWPRPLLRSFCFHSCTCRHSRPCSGEPASRRGAQREAHSCRLRHSGVAKRDRAGNGEEEARQERGRDESGHRCRPVTKINNDQYRVSRAKTWGASRNGKIKAPRVVYQGKPEMARAKKFSSSFVVFLFLRPVFRLASAICWLLSRQLATATPSASPATRSDGHAIRGTPSSILDGRRRRGTQTPNKDHSVRPSVR